MLPNSPRLRGTQTVMLGLRHGWPIALGYFPVAITFGALAAGQSWPPMPALGLSMLVFAGAAQFLALQMTATMAAPLTIITATFFLNLRHLLYSSSLAPRWSRPLSPWTVALLSGGITDETFSVTMWKGGVPLQAAYAAVVFATAYGGWVLGTAAGYFVGGFLPTAVSTAFGAGLYALFIALLWPMARASWRLAVVALAAALVHTLFLPWLGTGWAIVAAIMVGATLGLAIGADGEAGAAGAAPLEGDTA